MNKIHLICNPVSGQAATVEALNQIKDWAKFQTNLDLNIHITENIGHATIIAQDITQNNDHTTIIVLGGDGTINEVLNGIKNFENTYVGIIPYGSGNDFAASAGIQEKPDPVALVNAYINQPIVRKVDYMVFNDKYKVINSLTVGVSANVIETRNKMKHFKPKTQYTLATIARSFFWKGLKATITSDSNPQPTTIDTMWLTINNGTRIGGGIITAPEAQIDDGYMTCSYVKTFNHLKTFHHLAVIKKGNIAKLKDNTRFNCKQLTIDLPDTTIEFDGVLLEHQNKLNIKIVEKGLNLLVEEFKE